MQRFEEKSYLPPSMPIISSAAMDEKDQRPSIDSKVAQHSDHFKRRVLLLNKRVEDLILLQQNANAAQVLLAVVNGDAGYLNTNTMIKSFIEDVKKYLTPQSSGLFVYHFSDSFFEYLKSLPYQTLHCDDAIFLTLSTIFSFYPNYLSRLPKEFQDKLYLDFNWIRDAVAKFNFSRFKWERDPSPTRIDMQAWLDYNQQAHEGINVFFYHYKEYQINESVIPQYKEFCQIIANDRISYIANYMMGSLPKSLKTRITHLLKNKKNLELILLILLPAWIENTYNSLLSLFPNIINKLSIPDQRNVLLTLKILKMPFLAAGGARILINTLANASPAIRKEFSLGLGEKLLDALLTSSFMEQGRFGDNLVDLFPLLEKSEQQYIIQHMKVWIGGKCIIHPGGFSEILPKKILGDDNYKQEFLHQLGWRIVENAFELLDFDDRNFFLNIAIEEARTTKNIENISLICKMLGKIYPKAINENERAVSLEAIYYLIRQNINSKKNHYENLRNCCWALVGLGEELYKSPYCLDFFVFFFLEMLNNYAACHLDLLPYMGFDRLIDRQYANFSEYGETRETNRALQIFANNLSELQVKQLISICFGLKVRSNFHSNDEARRIFLEPLNKIMIFRKMKTTYELLYQQLPKETIEFIEGYLYSDIPKRFHLSRKDFFNPYEKKALPARNDEKTISNPLASSLPLPPIDREMFENGVKLLNSILLKIKSKHLTSGDLLRFLVKHWQRFIPPYPQSKSFFETISQLAESKAYGNKRWNLLEGFFAYLTQFNFEVMPATDYIFVLLSSVFSLFPTEFAKLPKSLQRKLHLDLDWIEDLRDKLQLDSVPQELLKDKQSESDEKHSVRDDKSINSVPNKNRDSALVELEKTIYNSPQCLDFLVYFIFTKECLGRDIPSVFLEKMNDNTNKALEIFYNLPESQVFQCMRDTKRNDLSWMYEAVCFKRANVIYQLLITWMQTNSISLVGEYYKSYYLMELGLPEKCVDPFRDSLLKKECKMDSKLNAEQDLKQDVVVKKPNVTDSTVQIVTRMRASTTDQKIKNPELRKRIMQEVVVNQAVPIVSTAYITVKMQIPKSLEQKTKKQEVRKSLISRIVYKPLDKSKKKPRPFIPSGPNTPGFNRLAQKSYQEKIARLKM